MEVHCILLLYHRRNGVTVAVVDAEECGHTPQLVEDITRGRSVYCPSYAAHCTLAYRRKPRMRWNDTALLLWLLYLQQFAGIRLQRAANSAPQHRRPRLHSRFVCAALSHCSCCSAGCSQCDIPGRSPWNSADAAERAPHHLLVAVMLATGAVARMTTSRSSPTTVMWGYVKCDAKSCWQPAPGVSGQ